MRNSWLPLLLTVIAVAAALALVRPGSGPGVDGPQIESGILRLPKHASDRVPAAGLRLAWPAPATPATPAIPARIAIAGLDRGAFTRALMLGLAETATDAGGLALLDPLPPPGQPVVPVPLSVDACLLVSTLSATAPSVAGAAAAAVLRLEALPCRLPADHPGAGWQPAGAASAAAVELSFSVAAADPPPRWSSWWATVGRAAAVRALAGMPDLRRPDDTPLADWGTPLRQPPRMEGLRWLGGFQFHLVRGWLGLLPGRAAAGQDPGDAFARLLAKTGWVPQPAAGRFRIWQRDRDGEVWCVSAAPSAAGLDLAAWQERPGAIALADAWSRDPAARALARAHAGCAALPADLRARLAATP